MEYSILPQNEIVRLGATAGVGGLWMVLSALVIGQLFPPFPYKVGMAGGVLMLAFAVVTLSVGAAQLAYSIAFSKSH